ncbi:MAG: hypothetical protein ACI9CB_002801, partial [Rhodothermales bacterium]
MPYFGATWIRLLSVDKMNEKLPQSAVSEPSESSKLNSDLIALNIAKAHEISKAQILVQKKGDGNVVAVTPDVFFALTLCEKFSTVKTHTKRIVKEVPALHGHSEQVEQVLKESIKNGLLISAAEVCNAILGHERDATQSSEPSKIAPAIVVIISWERPASLQRLLESMAAKSSLESIEKIYVVDDSRDDTNIKQNEEI